MEIYEKDNRGGKGSRLGGQLDVSTNSPSVVGKNTLRTSKLGSELHADFDHKEITF
jgi:hypothetical protein